MLPHFLLKFIMSVAVLQGIFLSVKYLNLFSKDSTYVGRQAARRSSLNKWAIYHS
jgi:hypothetical protein